MSAVNGKHGQGAATKRKEEGFTAIWDVSLGISKAPGVAMFPFWHLDMNAGPGWNEKANCDGSPVEFLRCAERAGRLGPIHAHFCDNESDHICSLRDKCADLVDGLPNCSVTYHEMDNADVLKAFAACIRKVERNPHFAMGTCLSDPNGPRAGFPLRELAEFAAEFPRIDMILNLNLNVYRAVGGCKPGCNLSPAHVRAFDSERFPPVTEVIRVLGRAHWFVRNPSAVGRGGGHQFMTLVGRSMAMKRASFKDFYPSDSPQGRRMLATLRRTEPSQRTLFPDMEG